MTLEALIILIIIGAVAGWLAGLIVKAKHREKVLCQREIVALIVSLRRCLRRF